MKIPRFVPAIAVVVLGVFALAGCSSNSSSVSAGKGVQFPNNAHFTQQQWASIGARAAADEAQHTVHHVPLNAQDNPAAGPAATKPATTAATPS